MLGKYKALWLNEDGFLEVIDQTKLPFEYETLVCGDGANDLSMFAHAGTRVAFCAREILEKEANIIIKEKDLRLMLPELKL